MEELKKKARDLIDKFKGSAYVYGLDCISQIGHSCAPFGTKLLLISSLEQRDPKNFTLVNHSLQDYGLKILRQTASAHPNTPREDVLRMKQEIQETQPDFVLAVSGGSGIDAAKAAIVLADLGGDFEDYFGTGQVTQKIVNTQIQIRPCIAMQTAAGSSAHLTKYSNITDILSKQKKLIVDDAIIPPRALFDYSLTQSMSADFTCDGAFDSLSHCLEVYYGAPETTIDKVEEIALTGIELILAYLERSVANPTDLEAREALGLAADLGGYAVMVGGTNGGHLTSFSLVDILSHGRACAILNPYYTVFFAPAIKRHLKRLASLLIRYGHMPEPYSTFSERELGEAVAQGLIGFSTQVGYPTSLKSVPGMTQAHLHRALEAAKNPQLEMKLKNMPVSLSSDQVDEYMRPILQAAFSGDFSIIKSFTD